MWRKILATKRCNQDLLGNVLTLQQAVVTCQLLGWLCSPSCFWILAFKVWWVHLIPSLQRFYSRIICQFRKNLKLRTSVLKIRNSTNYNRSGIDIICLSYSIWWKRTWVGSSEIRQWLLKKGMVPLSTMQRLAAGALNSSLGACLEVVCWFEFFGSFLV